MADGDAQGDDGGDVDLVRRAAQGDTGAFADLYRRHRDRVFRVCVAVLADRERAADVTQDVFVRLPARLRGFEGRAAFTTWLHRVTVNACHDELRRRTPVPVAEVPETGGPSSGTDAVVARLDLVAALARLPVDQRDVVALHDLEGYRYEEIADMLGVPIGTVKSRLARARTALASLLEPADGNNPRSGGVQSSRQESPGHEPGPNP